MVYGKVLTHLNLAGTHTVNGENYVDTFSGELIK